jgi:nitrogen fixation/metabolism regulation signal transduction histidine kinase
MDRWLESFAHANFLRSADTAHDLKTPLNVAVLNLELMRMRIRKLADGTEDEKVAAYAASIELELRRMARIFDTFFLLSTPPKNEGEPVAVDVGAICKEAASLAGYEVVALSANVIAHESRIRQAFKLFFEGASHVLAENERRAEVSRDTHFRVTISGKSRSQDFELTRIFKFYYTDSDGNPDLSLAAARLIAETYGGELNAAGESDKVAIGMSFPLGDK